MFQVLLADDEQAAVESMKRLIPWEKFDAELVQTASNGYEALGILESRQIDIAVLDIRMPGIDGLELCRKIREKNKSVQVIIVSGYAEFEYARQAISYGVLGYCLKPLRAEELTRCVLKAVHNLKRERRADDQDILEILEEGDQETLDLALARGGFDKDALFAAASIGEEPFLVPRADGLVISLGRGSFGYLLKWNFFAEHGEEFAASKRQKGLGYLERPVQKEALLQSLEQCQIMAYQFFICGSMKICTSPGGESAKRQLEEIGACIRQKKWFLLRSRLQELGEGKPDGFDVKAALKLCNMVAGSELFCSARQDWYVYGIQELVKEYGSMQAMLAALMEALDELRENPEGRDAYSNASFFQLIRYVDGHYREYLSLGSAAEALHMNPNYISQLFKKETGITFGHYIAQKRLEDAKELLSTTQKTVAEIAEEVGFNDYFYFLRTFKKAVGMTPGQYRMRD